MMKSTLQKQPNIMKKLRSKLPLRRARAHFTPIILFEKARTLDDSVSCLIEEASSDSSRVSVVKPKFQLSTDVSVSESSCCIESLHTKKRKFNVDDDENDDVSFGSARNSKKRKFTDAEFTEISVSSAVVSAKSGENCVSKQHFGVHDDENDEVSFNSVLFSKKRKLTDAESVDVSLSSVTKKRALTDDVEAEISISSKLHKAKSGEKCVSKSSSVFEFDSEFYCDESLKFESDLACTEQFVSASVQSSSQETLFTDLPNDLLFDSEDYFSDYTDSLFTDSGSEFSQGSVDESPPSLTFSLLINFREQFTRSSCPSSVELNAIIDDYTSVRFEDEEDEESYQLLRKRERMQLFLRDYTTEYGDFVFKQRSDMVSWIVEQSTAKEYHKETVFLGISLLDRFLSKGFFNIEKNFEIVGIACLTLATRIEENQPYNTVRQKNFHIGSNAYSMCEVVAMEWLVMEVLEFKCFLPTIHNFLWFYLRAARADAVTEKRAKYLAVLVLLNPTQLGYWPSTVAAGLVILASLEGYQGASYHRVIEAHVRTKNDDLPECIKSMEWLLQYL